MTSSNRAIAIVGYACRLPGADDAEAFWSMLESGTCVVGEVQADRWARNRFGHPDRHVPGKSYTWRAGQIADPWGFDPTFFGISPREAIQIDPQQRVLLQVVWEALEHAGIPPSKLAGTETGVYVGASSVDYSNNFVLDPVSIDIQLMTGNTLSIVSNRISYVFDLKGPSFTVDTACSSSVVALHEALEAMRSGRIDTAIVGGVNLLLSPFSFIGFSRASMLSPTGLCRAFDANGDGYVRSEGSVAFVLKTVEAARAAGDTIRGVLVGSGINSDGRTVGLSLPSSEQQAALLRQVYDRFEIDPKALAYIEAHGTGTRVGDPAEATALGTILGQRRDERLPIGSVKTNIGHLEAASGLAGLLKAQLALEKRMLPPSLHFDTPNPDIPFDDLNIEVVTRARPMADSGTLPHIGVNSFGFGGANAHAVLREPSDVELSRPPRASRIAPLVVSAQSPEALRQLASSYRDLLANADTQRAIQLTNAAAHRRDRLDHRVVALGSTPEAVRGALDHFLEKARTGDHVSGRAVARSAPVAFVFSGNGSQWAGMGRTAYQTDAAFRSSFDGVTRQFIRVAGWSLLRELFSPDLDTEIDRTEIAQPLLFAIQVATVDALAARGLKPDMVAGHSVGEVAAAWAAGALSLEAAVFLIHVRSTQQEITRHFGGMAALLTSAAEVAKVLDAPEFRSIELAADNSPRSVTLSGTNEALAEFAKHAKKNRWAYKKLKLDYPFHSGLIDPIRKDLTAALATLQPRETRIPFVSAVSGTAVEGRALDADYWWRNVRRPVMFRPAVETLAELGARIFVEIGPKPVLQTYVGDTLAGINRTGTTVNSLDTHDAEDTDVIGLVAARALVAGAVVDDVRFFGPPSAPAALPRYPWQNQPFRIDRSAASLDYFGRGDDHPLLGHRVRPGTGPFLNEMDAVLVPWLADHKVETSTVFPAAGFVEMALAATRAEHGDGAIEIRDLDIVRPMVLEEGEPVETRTTLDVESGVVTVESRRFGEGDQFGLHVKARGSRAPSAEAERIDLPAAGEVLLDADALYRLTRRFGLDYGPAFRRAVAVRAAGERGLMVTLSPPPAGVDDGATVLHPTLLDAAFHGLFHLITRDVGADPDVSFLPIRIGDLRVQAGGRSPSVALITIEKASPRSVEATFVLAEADGTIVARAEGVRFKAVRLSRASDPDDHVFTTRTVRIAEADEEVDLPGAWTDPVRRLTTLGVIAEAPETDEASLLIDAGCRSIAYAALAGIAGPGGRVDAAAAVASGRVAASAQPLFNRLIDALEEDGAVERSEDGVRIAAESPYPPAETVIATLVSNCPGRIAEAMALVSLQGNLARRLATGLVEAGDVLSANLADHLETSAPSAAPLHAAIARIATDIADEWPADRPLSVVLVGSEAPALARVLAAHPRVTATVVTDPDPSRVERMRIDLPAGSSVQAIGFADLGDGPFGPRSFELALTVGLIGRPGASTALDGLRDRLAGGGLYVGAEPESGLLADLVYGQSADWWRGSVSPDYPVGPRAGVTGYREILAGAGFREPIGFPLSSDVTRGAILVGRAPVRPAVPVDAKTDPVLVLVDAARGARRIADALAAVLADRKRVVRVAATRREADGRVVIEAIDAGTDDELLSLLASGEIKDLVYAASPSDAAADPLSAASERTMTLHGVLNGLMKPPARLWLVLPGGSGAATVRTHRPVESAVWGLGRVLVNEYPDIDTRMVDLAVAFEPSEAAERIATLLDHPGAERELVVDERGRAAIRIVRGPALVDAAAGSALTGALSRVLGIERQGSLDGLAWRTTERRAPTDDEVEIEVAAAGLNFRDVMWALGLLPEEALEDGFAGATLGMECSGVVTRVGPAATRFVVGDRVIAFAPACFASHVTVAEKALAPVPSTVDLEAAATIPVTFLTAYYALAELAQLDEGETVLIHGGAGGVGLAALQIALARGARVIATAGTADRRRLIAMLGATHVLDSRSLAFVDDVRRLTGGEGVDVVLNSLSGEAMERSLEVLKPFGRFVELGKRDYYANTQIALRPFRQNLSYFGVDADQLLTHRPKLTARVFRELVDGFEDGRFTALPYRIYAADRVTEAFRLMQQSGHVGKILVRPPTVPAEAVPGVRIRGDASYLVAGGLGGFGVETARFLVERGARHLVLTSRTGKPNESAAAAIAGLREAGAEVVVEAADLTDRDALTALFARIERTMPPLKGVLHTAMVIDDALFPNLDAARIEAVMAPKITGAANLDRLTRAIELDFFVLYSSATTLIGNPGQTAYVAANAYLEGLARARRAAGLPAVAIAWGAIGDAGYLARNLATNEMLATRLGKQTLTARAALEGLGLVLDAAPDEAVLAFARIDWAAARRELPIMATPLATEVATSGADTAADGMADGQLIAMIQGLDHAQAQKIVVDLLAGEISRILRLPAEEIDPSRPLTEIGMDSLMALELRMAAEQKLGVDIPLLSLANGATLGDIARRIVEKALARDGGGEVSAEAELAAARHVDGELDEHMTAVVNAVEARAGNVKRLI